MVITPDGRTLYVAGARSVPPISTATLTPGKRIHTSLGGAVVLAVTPDGKTVYAGSQDGPKNVEVTPISTATNRAWRPIRILASAEELVITPDGKTVYVASSEGNGTVTPISTANNRAGPPIHVGPSIVLGSRRMGRPFTPPRPARSCRSAPPPISPAGRSRSAGIPQSS